MYLHELISNFYISESLNDLFDEDKQNFYKFGNYLTNIVNSANYRQHMLIYLMFHEDKDSKSIPRLLNKIRDNKMLKDVHYNNVIKSLGDKISHLINEASLDIKNIKEYRDNVYAHWNKNLFKTEWQKQFKQEFKFDYGKLIELAKNCLEAFDHILFLFNEESYVPIQVEKEGIIKLIEKIKN